MIIVFVTFPKQYSTEKQADGDFMVKRYYFHSEILWSSGVSFLLPQHGLIPIQFCLFLGKLSHPFITCQFQFITILLCKILFWKGNKQSVCLVFPSKIFEFAICLHFCAEQRFHIRQLFSS